MAPFDVQAEAQISQTGSRRIRQGHLWVYAGDITREPGNPQAPVVRVVDQRGKPLGYAFYSAQSQIRLRLLSRGEPPAYEFLRNRIAASIRRRLHQNPISSAQRLVFGEADLLPSIVVDRYGSYVVLQTLSRGADAMKAELVEILKKLIEPKGIVERNDVKARALEGLEEVRGILWGEVPDWIEIQEEGIRFLVDLQRGQKTGLFLDQSDNRIACGRYAYGRALDCFTNTGGFALHFARQCESVTGIDSSADSLKQAVSNARLNGFGSVDFHEANVFDYLRDLEAGGKKFNTICLDPPAFAKNRRALPAALGGYKEINLRAMKLLEPEGILVTSSCSYHLSEPAFFDLLLQAAHDAHRYVHVIERRSQASDHPVLASMPETHYLKCYILRVL